MKIPLLDIQLQNEPYLTDLKKAVLEVVEQGNYIMGSAVSEFEQAIAQYLNVRHAIGVSSGTDALLVSLMALDVKPGDVVITSNYSFFATAGCVARLGAKPSFIDINPQSFNLCPIELKARLQAHRSFGDNVAAIIPVHLYGQTADMPAIKKIAEEFGVPVIEDAAQALGSLCPLDGKDVFGGTIGELGCYSFFPSKNLGGLGDGGLVTTNDDHLAERVKILRVHGSKPKYYHKFIGGNFRLDTIQAAALKVKLPYLKGWEEGRRKNAEFYDQAFAEVQEIKTPTVMFERHHHVYNQYVLMVGPRRNDLMSFLQKRGVATAIYYPVAFSDQECFAAYPHDKETLQKSLKAADESLAIPIFPELREEQLSYVVESIKEFFVKD